MKIFNQQLYMQEYYQKNRDKIREDQKKYWENYRFTQTRIESYTKWNRSPKGIYRILKSNSKKKGRNFELTQEEFLNWYLKQEKKCSYCEIPEKNLTENPLFMRPLKTKEQSFRLSIDRIDNNQSYKLNNIVLACRLCNAVKNNIFTLKEMKEIAQKYIKTKWQK